MRSVPEIRIRRKNVAPVRAGGKYVLYWMIANRRLRYNFALDRALEHCRALGIPLVVFEALRVDYPWASGRLHRFVLDGMEENARECEARAVRYFPYVELKPGDAKGLLAALAAEAAVVVTDEFPCFFLPKMVASAAKQIPALLEAVDSNGLLPLYATDKVAQRACDFRRYLQKELPKHLEDFPLADPFAKRKLTPPATLPRKIMSRWRQASSELLAGDGNSLAALPINHSVRPAALRGGRAAARVRMRKFFEQRFPLYAEHRNEPEQDVASGLSPYLHFGHVSTHELFAEVVRLEKWEPGKLSLRSNGSREGWWNMSPAAECFLDELLTWREAGYNFATHRADHDRYQSLPEWVQKTLREHASDEREHVYSVEDFESARTHDPLWNAAQRQLVREGKIHNYLRMLWGKKILEWSRRPEEAARTMIHLNNKYALDGRDPNSYSGIFWVFGRYDRPWGPERPIFGAVRYMSSESTARKMPVKGYLQKYGAVDSGQGQPSF